MTIKTGLFRKTFIFMTVYEYKHTYYIKTEFDYLNGSIDNNYVISVSYYKKDKR